MGILQAILKEVRAIDPHPGVKGFLQKPPVPDPVNPDAYIILDGATGAWNGHDDEVVRWDTIVKVWRFDDFSATNTHIARVEDPGGLWYYDASSNEWVRLTLIGGVLHMLSDATPIASHFGVGSSGTSSAGSRSDHVHDLGTPRIPEPVADIALVGTGSAPAKDDHVHTHGDQGADGGLHFLTTDSDAGFFSPAQKAVLEATGPLATAVQPVGLDLNATAALGAATEGARADHVHEVLAPSSQPTTVGGTQPNIGISAASARADHVHPITTGLSQTVGQGNDQGSGTAIALANHVHAHGQQLADGDAHKNATTSTDGFLSKADKDKLDAAGVLSTSFPAVVKANFGTSTPGSSGKASDANHQHEVATSNGTPSQVSASGGDAGDSIYLAHADHSHQVSTSTNTPAAVHNSSGTAGGQSTLARSDHRHAHGNLSGSSLHAESSEQSSGFISAANTKKVNELFVQTMAWCVPTGDEYLVSTERLPVFEAVQHMFSGIADWTATSGTRLTCTRSGHYKITGMFTLTPAVSYQESGDRYNIQLRHNGAGTTFEPAAHSFNPPNSGEGRATTSFMVVRRFSSGDYLEFSLDSNSIDYTMRRYSTHVVVERAL